MIVFTGMINCDGCGTIEATKIVMTPLELKGRIVGFQTNPEMPRSWGIIGQGMILKPGESPSPKPALIACPSCTKKTQKQEKRAKPNLQ